MEKYHQKLRLFSIATYITAYAVEHGGHAPTFQEIANHFCVSKTLTQIRVEELYQYGVVERLDGKLVVVGSTYVPPTWYLENLPPPLSRENKTEESRRNRLPALHTS